MNRLSAFTIITATCAYVVVATANEAIHGSWVYTYKDTQCKETYTFHADGTYKTTSAQEIITGKYRIESIIGFGNRQKLTFYESHDNGLVDCYGTAKKFEPESFLVVEITGGKMAYYAKQESATPIIELEKVK